MDEVSANVQALLTGCDQELGKENHGKMLVKKVLWNLDYLASIFWADDKFVSNDHRGHRSNDIWDGISGTGRVI